MKQKTVTLSKTIKLPIEGVPYSNRVVSATIEFEGEIDNKKAWDEINRLITLGQEGEDPNWTKPEKPEKIDQKPGDAIV